jgi:hypothetical protein
VGALTGFRIAEPVPRGRIASFTFPALYLRKGSDARFRIHHKKINVNRPVSHPAANADSPRN